MNLKLVQAPRREPTFAEPSMLALPEYPIRQAFGSNDPVAQQQLMQQASRGTPEPDHTLFVGASTVSANVQPIRGKTP